ncbi:putative isomerase, 3-hydroxyacyl-CoA dehydrogenase, Enoyl-CoA hydratase [Helianthus annuus]|nr:putative isomerase, 3-hydroxyacyl-CoA dehydrogenase, Enoyl-CoA hydratase [Helianthus annuus]KAJ0772431.1 putative isomerase, 3-hydroxyacyl-CoA dehydrogenase, Enoyl-CoA hydratase [Helianthus annuus]
MFLLFFGCSGGIIFWADLVGSKHIYASLKKWSEKYGNFYKPSRILEERAMKGVPLVRNLNLPTVRNFEPFTFDRVDLGFLYFKNKKKYTALFFFLVEFKYLTC